MAKRKTHNVVFHDGQAWHTVGNVMHDDETGRDIFWLNPHVAQRAIANKKPDGKDIPCLMAPYTPRYSQEQHHKAQPAAPQAVSNPPGGVQPTTHAYNEPPMDFDDDIPF